MLFICLQLNEVLDQEMCWIYVHMPSRDYQMMQ